MKKMKATRPKTIKALMPLTTTILLQAAIQQAYAVPCSTDNSIQITANNGICTATLTEYSGSNSLAATVLVSGSGTNLTLLDNTVVNVPGSGNPSAIFIEGNDNTLNTGNLTINYKL